MTQMIADAAGRDFVARTLSASFEPMGSWRGGVRYLGRMPGQSDAIVEEPSWRVRKRAGNSGLKFSLVARAW